PTCARELLATTAPPLGADKISLGLSAPPTLGCVPTPPRPSATNPTPHRPGRSVAKLWHSECCGSAPGLSSGAPSPRGPREARREGKANLDRLARGELPYLQGTTTIYPISNLILTPMGARGEGGWAQSAPPTEHRSRTSASPARSPPPCARSRRAAPRS